MADACPNCGALTTEGARFCASCGFALAPAPSTDEQRKIVTILFADVTGSTELGAQLDPERLRALLGSYFEEMTGVIESWGGLVEKYIGDAIMAVFGVPVVREDDADRALHAALEMGDRLASLNQVFEHDHQVRLEIRIGINTGEVVAPVGVPRDQQIVTGDAVNVAARLEQAAQPGTILVGERTYVAGRAAFTFEAPTGLDLKGKSAPVTARRLVAERPEPSRGIAGLSAPMIGRDRELATLLGLFAEAVESGQPRMTVIYGPAGIGKSRLAREFVTAARARGANVLRGRCLPAGHSITYWALSEILHGVIGVGLSDPVEDVQRALAERVRPILAHIGLSDGEADRSIAALAATAGIGVDERDGGDITAEDISRAWPRLATGLAASGPVVWLIEDLHWAGSQLPDLLQRTVAGTEGPLVLLATARPEFAEAQPDFAAWGGMTSAISLRPLTDAQSDELVNRLLAIADLPEAVRREILAKAEGNPFFVEEIIQRLIDEGTVVEEDGHWRSTGSAPPSIPDSVQALVAARIDGLAAAVHRVLQEASVVGRTFWEPPLERVVGGDVSGPLRELERKALIVARPTTSVAGSTEYMFKHALVRDVAYASLPKARRARAHAAVGAWLESIAADRTDELAELVADHFYSAVAGEDADLAWLSDPGSRNQIRERAFRALVLAGQVARRRFAIDRAAELHAKAVSLAAGGEERIDAYEQLGRDHDVAFHGDEALAAYEAAIDIARGDPAWRNRLVVLTRRVGTIVALRGGSFRGEPNMANVDALLDEGLAAVDEPRERAALLLAKGAMFIRRAFPHERDARGFDERLNAVKEAARIAADLDPALRFSIADTMIDLYVAIGDYPTALRTMREAMPLLGMMGDPAPAAPAYFEAAMTMLDVAGDLPVAMNLAERSYELARPRSPHEQMHATFALMRVAYRMGDWDRMERALEEHMANFNIESGVRCINVQMGPSYGSLLHANRGRLDRALELARMPRPFEHMVGPIEGAQAGALIAAGVIDEGLALARRVLAESPPWRALDAADAALTALTFSDEGDALQLLVTDLSGLRSYGPHMAAVVARAQGQALVLLGRQGGIEALREALATFEAEGAIFEAARTLELIAGIVSPREATTLLSRAQEAYRGLGATPHRVRVEERLAAL